MSWERILGHDRIRRAFEVAWKKNRLGHAYLFIGPVGVGKATFARELSKALFCERKTNRLEACDACPSCVYFNADTHADFMTATRPEDSLEMPIEVIRELTASLALKPSRGSRKIAIIEDADELNDASANAFLKTLEEPPPGSMLILIGGPSAETQLTTILSRCQIIRFGPLPPFAIRELLSQHEITDSKKQDRLIRLAGGSIGQALALDDESLWKFRETLLQQMVDPRRNSVDQSREWMKFIEEAGKDASLQRRRAGIMVRLLIEILQSALKVHQQIEIEADATESGALQAIAQRTPPERLMKWIDRCLAAEMHLDRRVQLILIIEGLLDSIRELRMMKTV